MEYKLVVASGKPANPEDFNKKINEYLNDGFELYGNPCVKSVKFNSQPGIQVPTFYFCQALIKR